MTDSKKRKQGFKFNSGAILRNPVVMAPMTTYSSNENGTFSEEELLYYENRAKDVGMVIVGCAAVSPNGYAFVNPLTIENDNKIEGFTKVATMIKAQGAKAVQQLFHAGRMGLRSELGDKEIVCASAVPAARPGAETPRELTGEEVSDLIQDFYNATVRAIKAGFDGVEIHGANTFLIQQFFSPHSNRRTDEWGGNLEKRIKFPMEVIKAAQKAKAEFAGTEFIIGYRISLEELEKPGLSLADSLYLIDKIANSGVDYLHLSLKKGYKQCSLVNVEDATPIGKTVIETVAGRIPVIGVSDIVTEEQIADAFDFGYDLVAVGKGLILNPRLLDLLDQGQEPVEFITQSEAKEIHINDSLIGMIHSVPAWADIIREE